MQIVRLSSTRNSELKRVQQNKQGIEDNPPRKNLIMKYKCKSSNNNRLYRKRNSTDQPLAKHSTDRGRVEVLTLGYQQQHLAPQFQEFGMHHQFFELHLNPSRDQ